MKTKKLILCMIFACISTIVFTCSASFAALQSNPTTHANPKLDKLYNWIGEFRKIETSEGGLGYNQSYNSTTLEPESSSASNGIDIHMMKTTEYGIVAILTASGYGNPTTSGVMTSSTGNNTGVMFNQNSWEVVAGGYGAGVGSRYYEIYTDRNSAKRGDGLGTATTANPGTTGWRDGSQGWLGDGRAAMHFTHGYGESGGLFATGTVWYYGADWQYSNEYARGVAVVGSNIE